MGSGSNWVSLHYMLHLVSGPILSPIPFDPSKLEKNEKIPYVFKRSFLQLFDHIFYYLNGGSG